jgi:hypothetical protein
MLGYYRDDEATREVTRSGGLLTGDLAANLQVSPLYPGLETVGADNLIHVTRPGDIR